MTEENKNILIVRYNRLLGDYKNWHLWIWDKVNPAFCKEINPVKTDDFGLVFEINLVKLKLWNNSLGFLPKYKNWQSKDTPDRFYFPDMGKEIYILEGSDIIHTSKPKKLPEIKSAFLDSKSTVRLVFDRAVKSEFLSKYRIILTAGDTILKIEKIRFFHGEQNSIIYLDIEPQKSPLTPLGKRGEQNPLNYLSINRGSWQVNASELGKKPVYLGEIVYDKHFRTNHEMGVIFHKNSVTFRLFAPFASEVTLLLKRSIETKTVEEFKMEYSQNGIWQLKLKENITEACYRYKVSQKGVITEGIDPYAKAVTAHNGWAMVTDDKTVIACSPQFKHSESVIYELHIRDFTIDSESGIKFKGKYLGFAQENTRHTDYKDMKTGLDHLKELGINTVQIMPVADFENDETGDNYRWGYMPVNFNSPDGWYATETKTAARISELKKLIGILHENGIKVILDVVYNHTAENNSHNIYNFNAVALDYYYRRKSDESYYNGSGCGNEFKTDSPMGRKFVIDSLKMWVEEYKVDGFRFDLMGLIDLETIDSALKKLKHINPDIIFYGEPWVADHTPLKFTIHKGVQKNRGFGVFNDNFRDAIKGSVFDLGHGYVQAGLNYERIKKGIMGSIDDFCASPMETINYASCHDGHTLFDRIVLSTGGLSLKERIKMAMLANAIILTSQGLPFIHSGTEFLRTKKGEHNSYDKPDIINRIHWQRKKRFQNVFEYYKGLIALRKEHAVFRMKNAKTIRHNLNFYEYLNIPLEIPFIGYVLNGRNTGDSWDEIIVLINPAKHIKEFPIPDGEFKIAVKDETVSLSKPLGTAKHKVKVPPISLMVLYR